MWRKGLFLWGVCISYRWLPSRNTTKMGIFSMDKDPKKEQIEGLPAWVMTPKEEKAVLEEYQKEVWRKCDEYVQAFKRCEAANGFSVLFRCKEEGNAMRECVQHHHQHEYVDEVRDTFLRKKIAAREAERAEKQ